MEIPPIRPDASLKGNKAHDALKIIGDMTAKLLDTSQKLSDLSNCFSQPGWTVNQLREHVAEIQQAIKDDMNAIDADLVNLERLNIKGMHKNYAQPIADKINEFHTKLQYFTEDLNKVDDLKFFSGQLSDMLDFIGRPPAAGAPFTGLLAEMQLHLKT